MAVWLIADPLNARLRNENDMRKNDSVIRPQGGEVRRGHRGRTHVDAYGRLVAAHYGRIDGERRFYERQGMTIPGIYFNGEENDTNLEDEYIAKESVRRIQDRDAPPYQKKRKSLRPF